MERKTGRWLLGLVALLAASAAQARGTGSGKSSVTPPATKSSGPAAERAAMPSRPPNFDPRPGYLGGMGAAHELGGPLGPRTDLAPKPSYGEAGQEASSGADSHPTWRSGDAVRSWSANDVRAARVQQAPDLEWASAAPATNHPQEQRGPKR